MDWGTGQLFMASIFVSSTSIPYGVTTQPRKEARPVQKMHLSMLPNKHASRKALKTARK